MTSVIDKEMTLLLDTVEKAENKYTTKLTPKTIKIIKIVETKNKLEFFNSIK